MLTRRFFFTALLVAAGGMTAAARGRPPTATVELAEADRLFKDQHWAEARDAYDRARGRIPDWHAPDLRRAVEGAVACAGELAFWDDAISRLEVYIAHNTDALDEVAGRRLLAGFYLKVPHHGREDGDRLVHTPSGDDVQNDDQREAIRLLERAREVTMRLAAAQPPGTPEAERRAVEQVWIGTDFDLATALTQANAFMGSNRPMERWLGIAQAETNPAEVDRSRYPAVPNSFPDYDPHDPPGGIPRRPDGAPRFATLPAAYDPALVPAEKFLFLLTEIEHVDTSAHRDDAAKALLRRAGMAQLFYGPDLARNWVQWWQSDRGVYGRHRYGAEPPPSAPVPDAKLWQLGDDQALVPVGGWLKVVDLPSTESPLALLAVAEARCPQTTLLPDVRYARALNHQGRQQYPRALEEYRAILRDFPTHPRAADARAQIKEIERPGVALGDTETFFPGESPKLAYTVRNAERVLFTARRFDLIQFHEALLASQGKSHRDSLSQEVFQTKDWRKYLAKGSIDWSETVPPGQENRLVEASTLVPLSAPGAYVIEARLADGKTAASSLVVVTDILLLGRDVRDGDAPANLIVACDARTGRPLPNRALRVYECWAEPDGPGRKGTAHLDRQTCITDANGAVFYRRRHHNQSSHIEAAMVGEDGRIAYSGLRDAQDNDPVDERPDQGAKPGFLITDRPVYRPGATVHFCVWLRDKHDGIYRPPPAGMLWVSIYDSHRQLVRTITAQSDESGVVSGEYTLGPNAPLGDYSVVVSKNSPTSETPDGWDTNDGKFAVEEYRQPEFEVSVRPSATQARLGEKFKASVEARYYFGAPVTGAKVSYKVYREVFERSYFEPAEYDSLYGRGYGLILYPYPWLSWWDRWGGQIGWGPGRQDPVPAPRWSEERYDPRELVAQGEGTLDAAGKCEIEVDTARAKAEHGGYDNQYTLEATVTGASRRAVSGEGVVVVTRQGFYAYVEADRGWYRAGDEARLRVRALTPDNVAVAAKGQVIVSRIHYEGPNHDVVTEEEIERRDAETDVEGRLACKVSLPEEGQYHVAFRARDGWNEEVQGNAVFWVQGPRFDGRVYRSNALEIITEKRSYRVGETAHLLINTAGDDARVLVARRTTLGVLTNVRFVDAPRHFAVVDVPIDESCVPNMAFEATVIRDGRVRMETCELMVPPEQKLLNLSVRLDKDVYAPGEKGTVHIGATDKGGRPASGEVALTVFDRAVTAIQPESATPPDRCFYARSDYYPAEIDSSFDDTFSASAALSKPEEFSNRARTPDWWDGSSEIGAGMKPSPLLRLLRSGFDNTSSADRVIIIGSNIPSSEEVGPPAFLDDPSAAVGARGIITRVAGLNTDPSGSPSNHPSARPPEPEIRTRFADTALWLPALKLDPDGKADATFEFPQSLSAWRIHGYVVNAATQVGDGTAQAVTTKQLLVRLLSPRFFMERDEVVLSAAVNNDLPDAREITAEMTVPAELFQPCEGFTAVPDGNGNLRLSARVSIAAKSEQRFDWRVKVLRPGMATITVRALTDRENDGMRLAFPVQVHGIEKTLVQGGSFRVGEDGERTLRMEVPAGADPAQTRLEITLSPSLAGVMIDALPYLADYPYGCVEQTMSRFYPSVLVRGTLKKMGTDLEALGNQRRQMTPADLANRFGDSPVYDSERLERMIREGLTAIYNAEASGGGWGWWGGEEASLAQSVYVLQGLQAAREAGVASDENVYQRGLEYVWKTVCTELAKPATKQDLGSVQQQAYCAYILAQEPLPKLDRFSQTPLGDETVWDRWLDRLYTRRGELNNYGRALLALTLQHAKRDAQARTVLRNICQFVERDDSNETAHVRTPEEGWWFWWNSDIETNAWTLKALVALDPKSDLAPRLVKWLLNNRRGGSYWRSTRDTAQVIAAMTDYLLASGEGVPDCELSVTVDGDVVRKVHVTRENFFAFDNKIVAGGASFKAGPHEVTIRKQGAGALYYTGRLTYFTHEEGVTAARGEIGVDRQYYKLVPETKSVQKPTDGAGQTDVRTELRAGYKPVRLNDGDELASGELLEVVLKISAKNTYDYLMFEDPKPAGCEPVEVRSGQRWAGGFCANVEVRDTKTVFFVESLEPGEHVLRYRLRAETPGRFHVLPATGMATYAPEVRANSDETHVGIRD